MKKILIVLFSLLTALTLFVGCPDESTDNDGGPSGPGGPVIVNDGSSSSKAIPLTENVWTDGSIATSDGEQWFKFTATAVTQYIHVNFGTLTNLRIQLYKKDGTTTIGSNTNITTSSSNKYTSSSSLTNGEQYLIKVTPSSSSGTYQIAFNTSSTKRPLPFPEATTLTTANLWFDGNIPTLDEEQWFKFTATAATQYIHINFDNLANPNILLDNLNIQVYNSDGTTLGEQSTISRSSSSKNISKTLINEQVYYIKVTPYFSNIGTFQIAFNDSTTAPTTILLPSNAIQLTANVWANGNIPTSGGMQWFKFSATNATQYIHVEFDTLQDSVYIQLYNSSGNTVGAQSNLYSDFKISNTLTVGQEYYIKIWQSYYSSGGTYHISFNTTVISPMTDVITLTADNWTNGNIPQSKRAQWFKFTATAATQYIHIDGGTLWNVYVDIYSGNELLTTGYSALQDLNVVGKYTYVTVTIGQDYHIEITPYSGYGTYQITFNDSTTPPPQ